LSGWQATFPEGKIGLAKGYLEEVLYPLKIHPSAWYT